MINDVDETLKKILTRELPAEVLSQVSITFATPGNSLPNSVPLPAIDIFLYDIRENLELRTSEQLVSQAASKAAATTRLVRSPVNINFSYIITAWSSSTSNPEEDEHRLLGMVLQALLRYITWPVEMLQGILVGSEPLPRAQIGQPGYLQHIGEFWSAMGGRPKPVIHYTVTAPLYPFAPFDNVPLIKTITSNIQKK